MRIMKIGIVLLLVFVLHFSSPVLAEIYSIDDLEKYRCSEVEHKQILSQVTVSALTEYPNPTGWLKSVAISSNNSLGILVNSAPDSNYQSVAYVQDSFGNFIYGYQIHRRYEKGPFALFFINEDTLCLFYGWENALCVLAPNGNGINTTYRIKNALEDLPKLDLALLNEHINTNVAPAATFWITYCANSKLIIDSIHTGPITIYDQSTRYIQASQERNLNMRIARITGIVIILMLCINIFRTPKDIL